MKLKDCSCVIPEGFTRLELIVIIVVLVTGLVAFGATNFAKARATAQANACVNNLRLIDSAKQQFAMEQKVTNSNFIPAASQIQPYLCHCANCPMPICPSDPAQTGETSYAINPINMTPACLIVQTHLLKN